MVLNPLFEFVETGESKTGRVIGELEPTGNEIQNKSKAKQAGISVDHE